MNYLLISSDPIISANRLRKDKIIKKLSSEAKNLIKWTDLNDLNNNKNNNSSEDSDSEDCFENLEDDDISVEKEIE